MPNIIQKLKKMSNKSKTCNPTLTVPDKYSYTIWKDINNINHKFYNGDFFLLDSTIYSIYESINEQIGIIKSMTNIRVMSTVISMLDTTRLYPRFTTKSDIEYSTA